MEPFPPFTHPSPSSKLPLQKLAPDMPSPEIWEIVPDDASTFGYMAATTVSGDEDVLIVSDEGSRGMDTRGDAVCTCLSLWNDHFV